MAQISSTTLICEIINITLRLTKSRRSNQCVIVVIEPNVITVIDCIIRISTYEVPESECFKVNVCGQLTTTSVDVGLVKHIINLGF